MIIRNVKGRDVDRIQDLCRKYRNSGFELPEPRNIFADAVVEHEGIVIAYGVLKMLAEAVLILDHSLSPKDRGEALTLLIQEAVKESSKKGLLEVQAVCEPKFAKVMKKHYGFQKLDGETIVLDI